MGADYFSTSSTLPHDIDHRSIKLPGGADARKDLITSLVDEKVIENTKQWFHDTGKLDIWGTGAERFTDDEFFEGTYLAAHADDFEDTDADDVPFSTNDVAIILTRAVDEIGGRDCTYTEIHGVPHVETGGMSWGDTPTESFDWVSLLGASGVFDSPIVDAATLTIPNRASEILRVYANRLPDHDASKKGLLTLSNVVASMRDDLLMDDEAKQVFSALMLNKSID